MFVSFVCCSHTGTACIYFRHLCLFIGRRCSFRVKRADKNDRSIVYVFTARVNQVMRMAA